MKGASYAARMLGRLGGRKNSPAQQAARISNIAKARGRARTVAPIRDNIIRQRVAEACHELGVGVHSVGVQPPVVGLLLVDGHPPVDLDTLHHDLVERRCYPENYSLRLLSRGGYQ